MVWRPIAFRYGLTTSATVATRQSDLLVDDGANAFAEMTTLSTQAASLVNTYNWASGAQATAVANGIVVGPMPSPMLLYTGFRLRTHTINLQASDQYTAPQYLVEEWIIQ